MTIRTRIQVIDRLYVVGYTTDGRDFEPAGDGFKTPREAIDFSNELEGRPASRPGHHDFAGSGELASGDGGAQPEAPDAWPAARALPAADPSPLDSVAGRHIAP